MSYYDALEGNIKGYEFLFPHRLDKNNRNGREFYKKDNIDVVIAEVSKPATGLGIELGFLCDEGIPVRCFYQKGEQPSSSLLSVTDKLIEYENMEDFIKKVSIELRKF